MSFWSMCRFLVLFLFRARGPYKLTAPHLWDRIRVIRRGGPVHFVAPYYGIGPKPCLEW